MNIEEIMQQQRVAADRCMFCGAPGHYVCDYLGLVEVGKDEFYETLGMCRKLLCRAHAIKEYEDGSEPEQGGFTLCPDHAQFQVKSKLKEQKS